MFKLVVLYAFFAIHLAYRSLIAASPFVSYSDPFTTVAFHQPVLATVGSIVKAIPTSVTHSSHAVVHKSDEVFQDVIAPVIRTTYTPPFSYTTYGAGPASYAPYAGAPTPYALSAERPW